MKRVELIRWGVPAVAFLIYFKWGGPALSLILFGILFAIISGFIHWHRKDPKGFFIGVRAWIIVLLIVPSTLLAIGTALFAPVFLPLALIPLGISIWLLSRNNKKISESRYEDAASATQILNDQRALGSVAIAKPTCVQAQDTHGLFEIVAAFG